LAKIAGNQTFFSGCTFGLPFSFLTNGNELFVIVEESQVSGFVLVVVGIKEHIDRIFPYDFFVWGAGVDQTGIILAQVIHQSIVKMAKGIADVKVVETDESPDFRAGGVDLSIPEDKGAHIIEDDGDGFEVFGSQMPERFDRFAFASPAVAHDDKFDGLAALEGNLDHRAMDRQTAFFDHADVMEGENQLLHVAEVIGLIGVTHVTDEEIVSLVFVIEASRTALLPAEEDDDVRLFDAGGHVGFFKEVQDAKNGIGVLVVEIEIDQRGSAPKGQRQPFGGIRL
jgi:hypothetical protein